MNDLFNLNKDSFSGKSQNSRKIDENLYNPGPSQSQNGVYKSIIRFLPYYKNTDASKYRKYYAKLVNPLTNEKLWIDCPSTNGKSSILWTLDTELKKLKDIEPTIYSELTKNFSRSYNYFSPVYIKKDPQFPNLEGQIKIFTFGYTIDDLIQKQIEPEEDLLQKTESINPYDLIYGKDFVLVVKTKTKTWRDFSSCKFMNEVSPLIITQNGQDFAISEDPKSMKFAENFLTSNTPDMTPYHFKEWTDSDYAKVASFIKAIVPYRQVLDSVLSNLKDEKMKSYFTSSMVQGISNSSIQSNEPSQAKHSSLSVELNEDLINFEKPNTSSKPNKVKKEETQNDVEDFDDLLKNL